MPVGTPVLPSGTERPLCFDVGFEDEIGGNGVLIWHSNGLVDGVGIMYAGSAPRTRRKFIKAEQLGVKIVTPGEFATMLGL